MFDKSRLLFFGKRGFEDSGETVKKCNENQCYA